MPNTNNSTGPRTPEGKARSSRNALKHGLTARELIIAPGDEAAFAEFLAGFEQDLQPQGILEQTIFNQIVHSAWNLRRLRILETELIEDGEDPLLNIYKVERVERMARYAARAERTLHRSIRELRALQTGRLLRQAAAVEHQETPPLADLRFLTKRTPAAARDTMPVTRSSVDPITGSPDHPVIPFPAKLR
jgi:hypothetical protein